MGTTIRERSRSADRNNRSETESKITRWIEHLVDETSGIEPPIEIAISHAAVDQHRRLIRSYQIAALPVAAPELYRLVETIVETIEADADDLGGLQRYQLNARCHGQDVGSTTVRFSLDPLSTAIDSEPASERGLVAQAQRHAEAAVRMLVQGNGALLSSFQRRLADQDALIERLHARWVDSLETKEQIIRERAELGLAAEERKVDTEVRAARELAEIDRKTTLWNEAVSMLKFGLPVALQYLTGQKGGPSADHEAAETAYLSTITDEQLEQLRRRVPAELLGEFVEKVKRARAAGLPTPANATTTPAAATAPSPAASTTPPPRRALKPLEGDAKLGAARLLAEELLPLITARHIAGAPLMDPGVDDLSLYQLLRRLAASATATEWDMIMGALPADQRAATESLLTLLNISPPAETAVP